MTDYEIVMNEKKAREIFEEAIPEECRKCGLLERDFMHKKVKCLYRSNDNCILQSYIEVKDERNNNTKQNR